MSKNKKSIQQTDYPHIIKAKGVCGGKAVIKGTRIAVWHIVEFYYRVGLSVEEILADWDYLAPAQVFSALAYYYDHKTHIRKTATSIGKNNMPNLSHKPPKLHLNENLSPRLAAQLCKHGFDVTSSQGEKLLSAPDDIQLAYAASHKRAIVTFNLSDFSELHKEYLITNKEHWGILLSTAEPIGILLHRLLRLLHTTDAQDLQNQIRWLNEFK